MADRRVWLRRAASESPVAPARNRRLAERRLLLRGLPPVQDAETPAVLMLLGVLLAQALVVLALALGWWPGAALVHVPLCLALLLLRREGDPGWPGAILRTLALLLPALGPLAAVAAVVALLLGPPRQLRPAAAELPEDPLDARLEAIATAPAVPDGLLLESLGDVLRWGTPRQKARAIELAAEPTRPGGGALLRLALSDADPAVRARAEAQRPAVERRLLAQAEALHAAARGQSGAEGRAAQRALARALDRAAYSGLLEAPRAAACRAEAAGLWQSLGEAGLEQGVADIEAESALGRDLLALGDLPAARRALEEAVARDGAGAAGIALLADCLFQARDFASLEALVLRWRPVLEAEAMGAGPQAAAWRLWLAEVPG